MSNEEANRQQQLAQSPELAADQPAPSTFDPMQMIKMMALSFMSQQGGLPFLTSQMPAIQSPFGGPGMMSIPQRPASQSFDIWSMMMHVPNTLAGTNYPTKLQEGFYYPRPGQTMADVERNAAAYQSFSQFTQPINESNVGHVKGIIDNINQTLGFSALTYDPVSGRGSMLGKVMDSQMMAPIISQLASNYLGAPSMAAQNTIWEQRGRLGYNLARAEGRDRGMAPLDEDAQTARNFISTMQDTFFERGPNGQPNFLARRVENLYGFDPEQATRIMGVALQGGANIRTGTDMTKTLAAVSAATAFTGDSAQGIQDAINSFARQGAFNQDTSSIEKLTVNLRTMAKQLKELNLSQETMKDIYDQSEKMAVMATGGISTITGRPIGDTSMLASRFGLITATTATTLQQQMGAMRESGVLSRDLTEKELGEFAGAAGIKAMQTEYAGAGQLLYAARARMRDKKEDTTDIDRQIEVWKRTAGASPEHMTNMLAVWEKMTGEGPGSLRPNSRSIQAAKDDINRISQEDLIELTRITEGAMSSDISSQTGWNRYMKAESTFQTLQEMGGIREGRRGEISSKGLDAAIRTLKKTDPRAAAALTNLRRTKGDAEAEQQFMLTYQDDTKLLQVKTEAEAEELEKEISSVMTPEGQKRLRASLNERYANIDPALREGQIRQDLDFVTGLAATANKNLTMYGKRAGTGELLKEDATSAGVLGEIYSRAAGTLDPTRIAKAVDDTRILSIREAMTMKGMFNPQLEVMRFIGGRNRFGAGSWDDYMSEDEKSYINDTGILPQTQRERKREVTTRLTDKLMNNYYTKVGDQEVFNFGLHGMVEKFRDKDGIVDIGKLRGALEGGEKKGFMETMSEVTGINIPGTNIMDDIMKSGSEAFMGGKGPLRPKDQQTTAPAGRPDNAAGKGSAGAMSITLKMEGASFKASLDNAIAGWSMNQKDPSTLTLMRA